jgi:type I restriction enzyme S subunit
MASKVTPQSANCFPEEWKVDYLSEHVEIIGGGTPKTTSNEYWNGDIPWISVVDFVGGKRWIYDTEKHITKKGLENSSTKLLHNGQLIISARGTVGELSQVTRDMAFNQSCYGIDGKSELDNNYLFYLLKLKTKEFQKKGHGAVFNTITKETFSQILVPIPSLTEQYAIAKLLMDLDSKIEVNQRSNRFLEAIGETIFKSWFIDFEFPNQEGKPYKSSGGEMVTSELGEIPKAWKVGCIEEVAEVICGGTPSTKVPLYFTSNGIAWLTPKDISGYEGKFIEKGKTDITDEGLKNSSARLLPKGTILFTSRAPIGYLVIALNDITTNQGFKSLIPKANMRTEYLYQSIRKLTPYIQSISSGSTFSEVSGNTLKQVRILIPELKILDRFENLMCPINSKIILNSKGVKTLSNLRDSLLPRLMSGKIRVPVDSIVEVS